MPIWVIKMADINIDKIKDIEYIKINDYRTDITAIVYIDDINEYLKLINICNPKVVFKGYKERGMGYPYNEYFLFFDNNGIGYKINGNGYENLYDMYDGCSKGFPDGETYYKAMAGEFVDYNEYKKITEMGYYSKNDYLEAIELGFKWSFEKIKKYLCYEDYGIFSSSPRKYYIHDDDRETYIKSDRDVYYYAKKKGFKDFKEFEDAISKGFLNAEEYRDAMKKGFSDKETYGDAKEMGFDNPKEYEEAMKFGLRSKDEYDKFKRRLGKILDIKKEYELDTIEEAILFKILLNFEHGKKLSAEKIWNMWKDELEKYRNYIKNGIKFNNKDDLKKYLSNSSKIKHIGYYDEDGEVFERISPKFKKIIIDGSNVAWNNGSKEKGDKPFAKNIELVINKLKEMGYSDILVITDASLKHIVEDVDVLDKLMEEKILNDAPSKRDADDFILKFVREYNSYVITNDTFKDWKEKDEWVRKNMDKYRITFMIDGDIVKFDEKIEKVKL